MRLKHKVPARLTASWAVVALAFSGALGTSILAQSSLPQPRVGGDSTLDATHTDAGNGSEGVRRRLTPLGVVPDDFSTLKLAAGFLLSMDVYDTPEYSMELRIDSAGNVTIPMLSPIHIGDLTLVEASVKIASALREGKILTNPQVNLDIEEYAGTEVTVLGEVHAPGRIELLAPRHLDEVIAMAGGETEYAGKIIEIRHHGTVGPQTEVVQYSRNVDNSVLSKTVVQPGDVVTVKRAGIVYVLGGVARPGGYIMQEDGDLSVTQALALAYGTTMSAAVGSMRLIRKTDDGRVEEIPIPYRAIVKGKIVPMRLQAEDIIYIPISKIKTVLGSGLVNTGVAAAVIYDH